jgi:hypothetical protein
MLMLEVLMQNATSSVEAHDLVEHPVNGKDFGRVGTTVKATAGCNAGRKCDHMS